MRDEFKQLKRQMCAELRKKCDKPIKGKVYDNPAVAEFIEEAKKYKEAATSLPKKGNPREQMVYILSFIRFCPLIYYFYSLLVLKIVGKIQKSFTNYSSEKSE